MSAPDRPRGYRRVPIVTNERGTRNLCTPVSPEMYVQFEELCWRVGQTKAAMLKTLVETAIAKAVDEKA